LPIAEQQQGVLLFSLSVLLGIVLFRRPLAKVFAGVIDQLAFKKSAEYQKIIREAAKGMIKVQELSRLFKLIAYFIGMRVKASHVALFYFDKKSRAYALKVKRGRFRAQLDFKIDALSPIVEYMNEKKDVVVAKEIDALARKNRSILRQKEQRVLRILRGLKDQLGELGAAICVPCFSKDKLLGFLILGPKRDGDAFSRKDITLLSTLSHEVAVAVENAILYEELSMKVKEIELLYDKEKKIFLSTVLAFATAIDAKDPYTHGHTERVTKYCLMIKEQFERSGQKFPKEFDKELQVSALLHDVGKIGTPDYILNKKGPLTKEEYEEIKKHSLVGASILRPIDELNNVALAIRHHQERWDGLGYPDGLQGGNIPLISRIVMVADAFDALVSDRPYRPGVFEEMAFAEIRKGSGTQFDPAVADAFVTAYQHKGDFKREVLK